MIGDHVTMLIAEVFGGGRRTYCACNSSEIRWEKYLDFPSQRVIDEI